MKFSEYLYERPDLEKLKADAATLFREMKETQSALSFENAVDEFIEMVKHVESMATLVQVRHSINTKDEYYEKENDWWDDNMPYFEELNMQYYKILMASPHLKAIQEKYPKTYFQLIDIYLKTFDPKIIQELQEENKLVTSYNRLIASAQIPYDGKVLNLAQMRPYTESADRKVRKEATEAYWGFFKENEKQLDEICDKLVKLRDKIAKKLGFNNFIELGYCRMRRLDYNKDMVAGYRKQILDEVVPLASKLYKRQAKRIGVDKLKYFDMNLNYLDGNAAPKGSFDDTIASGRQMYHELSEETGEFIDFMMNNELMDLIAKPGKESGGYMTYIPDYQSPFIFANFNGTSGDVDVLTHEAGHAFQGYLSRHITIPEVMMPTHESCEIHSMSMEFITWPFMEKFFGDKADKYRFAHLGDALEFLPYGVLVDHYQHEVYANPEMTPDERKETWRRLDKMYRPHLDFDDNEFAEKGTWWLRQGHIFQMPFYYIDYTLAQVCAFQFWKRIHVDHDPKAWSDYLAICKVGGTQSFLEIVKTAGLISPFEDGCLKSVVGEIDKWLESIDDTKL
ncbi:MAG TPA: M3 family oligoendopeptidase [Clostridiales bacterium]|nr:M3 family oligoendopeptidase [Clostridiales bacterium]